MAKTVLKDLQMNLVSSHTVDIIPISSYQKDWNKSYQNKSLRHVYAIHIYHPDSAAGYFFSKYASYYNKLIEAILAKHSKGKLYSTCCTECGNDLTFDVMWNKDRLLRNKGELVWD